MTTNAETKTLVDPDSVKAIDDCIAQIKKTRKSLVVDDLHKILEHIRKTGTFHKACRLAGISPSSFYQLKEISPEFAQLAQDAKDQYRFEVVEGEVHRRAITGWLEPVYHNGRRVGTKRRYSDRLLEMHAKRHIAEYRDHTTIDANIKAAVLVLNTALAPTEDGFEAAAREHEKKLLDDK